jgi:ATP-dependent Clp protease ATP-binding subunit ClpB
MSEYQQEFAVSRLFGAPPGYVGYDRGGQLTEAVRRKPYSVVLLDEIEKAHSKVFETLLQVLDDGRMTDGQGRTVDFKNTIVIMTSNLKMEDLRLRMAPEFINRIDGIVKFNPLGMDEIRMICRLQLDSLQARMKKSGISISFDESAVDLLAERSFQPEYGARPVKRAINELIVDALSMKVLGKEVSADYGILVSVRDGAVHFCNVGE